MARTISKFCLVFIAGFFAGGLLVERKYDRIMREQLRQTLQKSDSMLQEAEEKIFIPIEYK